MICPDCKGRRYIWREIVTPPCVCGKAGVVDLQEEVCPRCFGTGTVDLEMKVVKIGETKNERR